MNIGSVVLDNDLLWSDEFQDTLMAGVAERAIEGHIVVQTFPLYGGRLMTLAGNQNFGWQSRATVEALRAMINVEPTFVVILPDLRQFTVAFRPEEAPVMSWTPVVDASAPGAAFWYYGDIKLRIVG